MLSYYKKVFLRWCCVRFSFFSLAGLAAPLLGGLASGGASGLLGGLFGGGGGEKKQLEGDIIRAQLEEQAREDQLAGSGDKSTIPQPSAVETKAERLGKQVGEMGRGFAGDFIEKLGSRFIDQKITSMFAPKPINPAIAGARDKAYTNARFPGVNPWELAGGGAASGGQGGRVPQQIAQRTAAETAAVGARSQERVAGVTTAPRVEEVNVKYAKLPHEIAGMRQAKELQGAQAVKLNITNSLQRNLTSYEAVLKQAQGDVAFQQKNNLVQEGKKLHAQTLNEIARLPETKAKAKIQGVLSEYAQALAAGKIGAPLIGILGTLLTLLGLRGLSRKGKTGRFGPKTSIGNPKGKIQNWPKYGPKAGQTFK